MFTECPIHVALCFTKVNLSKKLVNFYLIFCLLYLFNFTLLFPLEFSYFLHHIDYLSPNYLLLFVFFLISADCFPFYHPPFAFYLSPFSISFYFLSSVCSFSLPFFFAFNASPPIFFFFSFLFFFFLFFSFLFFSINQFPFDFNSLSPSGFSRFISPLYACAIHFLSSSYPPAS